MPLSTIFQLYRSGQFYLMEETGVPGENHRPAQVTDDISINICETNINKWKRLL